MSVLEDPIKCTAEFSAVRYLGLFSDVQRIGNRKYELSQPFLSFSIYDFCFQIKSEPVRCFGRLYRDGMDTVKLNVDDSGNEVYREAVLSSCDFTIRVEEMVVTMTAVDLINEETFVVGVDIAERHATENSGGYR